MVTVFVEILKLSVLLYVGFLNIRRYVLYLYIETLKQRLDAINQLRVDRALAAMGPAFQQVYSLLPTLLHYHHPLMPGYLDGNVPRGICLYTPDETQRHYLDELELNRGMLAKEPPKGELPITGLYSMGSTSSVGQSCSSDLDIWVCHQSWLDSEERQLLQRKCSLLESWAASSAITKAAAWAVKTAAQLNTSCCWMSFTVPRCAWPGNVFCGIWCRAMKKSITTIT